MMICNFLTLFPAKLNGKTDVAVKFSFRDSEASLRHEYKLYEKLAATYDINCEKYGIPYVYYFGRITHYYDVMVMTLLDRSVHLEFIDCCWRFTRETQLLIFINLVSFFKVLGKWSK